jgi:hypothetical protein
MTNKNLDVTADIASLPLCERDAFEERCKKYSCKMGLDRESEEVKKAVYIEMYLKRPNSNS